MIQEQVLQQLWHLRYFCGKELTGTRGEIIRVISSGILNTHAGPDFFNARVRIGETEWAGNVEMHLRSSDWIRHKHQHDPGYESIILHVVLEHDADLPGLLYRGIPTLELQSYLPPAMQHRYAQLIQNRYEIPCEHLLTQISMEEEPGQIWLERLSVERLEQKVLELNQLYEQTKGDSFQVLFMLLAKYFGQPANAQPFEQLAFNLGYKLMQRYSESFSDLELLVFGSAGLIPDAPAFLEQTKEFKHFSEKHTLRAISAHLWKHSRMRPASFPENRLFQFALIMRNFQEKYRALWDASHIIDLKKRWFPESDIGMHSQFYPNVRAAMPNSGFASMLTLNVFIPFLFASGKWKNQENYCDRALMWLLEEKAEDNHLIQVYKRCGIPIPNALASQALLQMRKKYCTQLQCLRCYFGQRILLHDSGSTK